MDDDNLTETVQYAVRLLNGRSRADLADLDAGTLEAVYAMAHSRYNSRLYEEAARAFQYLCFYDQWNARNFLGLAACQKMLGLPHKAMETYLFGYSLNNKNSAPLVYMGECLMALNKPEQAKAAFDLAMSIPAQTGIPLSPPDLARLEQKLQQLEAGEHKHG